jgi:hypothetical protein
MEEDVLIGSPKLICGKWKLLDEIQKFLSSNFAVLFGMGEGQECRDLDTLYNIRTEENNDVVYFYFII